MSAGEVEGERQLKRRIEARAKGLFLNRFRGESGEVRSTASILFGLPACCTVFSQDAFEQTDLF